MVYAGFGRGLTTLVGVSFSSVRVTKEFPQSPSTIVDFLGAGFPHHLLIECCDLNDNCCKNSYHEDLKKNCHDCSPRLC